jgi:hypothetical protein
VEAAKNIRNAAAGRYSKIGETDVRRPKNCSAKNQ